MRPPGTGMALFLGLTACACGLVDLGAGPVEVRLQNGSAGLTFSTATLFTTEGPLTYRDVGPGEFTPYVEVEKAYRIATTEVIVEADTLRLQVIDFVGEEPLEPGRYTYVLTVSDANGEHRLLTQELHRP